MEQQGLVVQAEASKALLAQAEAAKAARTAQQATATNAGQPVQAIAVINGKIVVVQANAVPFLIRGLIAKFSQSAAATDPANVAAFYLFIEALQRAGVTTTAGLYAFVNTMPNNTTKGFITKWLIEAGF